MDSDREEACEDAVRIAELLRTAADTPGTWREVGRLAANIVWLSEKHLGGES